MTRADDAVATRLDADRKALLDLTLRNPLLNYRPRARGLEFVGEPPVEVYRLLVTEGRALSFLHDPDAREVAPNPEAPSPATGDDSGAVGSTTTDTPLVEEPSADKPPASEPVDTPVEPATEAADSVRGRAATSRRMPQANPTDHKLQTTLSAEQLEARLLSIYYAARTSIEERGVNTLFLVLGMLNWSDGGSPERLVRAPLILIPVELQRSSARERYRIRLEGEDVGFNLSLAEKLRTGFRLTLPALPDADELDVAGYFRAVAEAVSSQKSWSVDREAVALGFFSFGKFLMYLDLDTEVWPPTEAPAVHPLLAALLGEGFREPAARVGDDEPVDPHIDPRTARQVVDADSSQSLALLDVKHGRNLVIQGPPGTGKSQTITNLIAEAVAQGKTVLFVAEKLAALEVVKRRLDQAGVGDVCLELHSHKTQKKAVLAELRRTLQLVKPRLGAVDDDVTRLIAVRDRLNAYAEALNAPIGASGTTPFDAIGNVVEARGARESEPLPRPALPEVDSWSRADFLSRLALAEQLQARVLETGPPRRNPFWGSRCTLLLPADLDRLRSAIPEARMATQALDRAGSQLATLLGLDAPRSPRMVDQLVHAADWLVTRPALPGCQIRAAEWRARRPEIQAILAAIEAFRAVTGKPENRSVWVMAWEYGHDPSRLRALWDGAQESIRRGQSPDATGLWPSKRSYGEDLSGLRALRADHDRYGRPWWHWISPAFWRTRAAFRVYFAGQRLPRGLDAQLAVIDDLIQAQGQLALLERHRELATRLLGGCGLFDGRCDWARIALLVEQFRAMEAAIDECTLPAAMLDVISSPAQPEPERLRSEAARAREARLAQQAGWSPLVALLRLDPNARFGNEGLDEAGFSDLDATLASWSEQLHQLPRVTAWNALAERARGEGMGGLVDLAEHWDEAGTRLAQAFRSRWFETLLEGVYAERPALGAFEGRGHEIEVALFGALDGQVLRHARDLIVQGHWTALPRHEGLGQLAILRREFEKKARHLPVRQLMARAGQAVQAIKPVFMMSPMSVAAFLPPGTLRFDLIVFDEASQVRPVDAFGALLRGKQAVVVGDSRQLPPTSFFDRLVGGTDLDESDDSAADVESILGLFSAQGAPERMLRWHYRSRHESLIAVSNHEFYDSRLVIFPSPEARRGDVGLVLRHLPETVYDRGGSRTNRGEAEAVAAAVMAFARAQLQTPERERLTLGVAAFSTPQREAIVDRLEALRRDDPSCEPFFAEGAVEPFFVKNLENVQGDERDVIFISVGYGRNAEGRIALNFGPLNAEGGERRLNVLITRARLRCEVFTNLQPEDLDLERSPARGMRALRTFLAYARDGRIESRQRAVGGEEPPTRVALVEMMAEVLRQAGHEVDVAVGISGVQVDLAVRDPDMPGRYRLGITCDGPTYHSARSARDRDRLRRQVLEKLGWRLHRVWSADWFRDPGQERVRLLAAAEARPDAPPVSGPPPTEPEPPVAALEQPPAEPDLADSPPTEPELAAEPEPTSSLGAVPYAVAEIRVDLRGREFHEIPAPTMARWVADVVAVEGPVHLVEVSRRLLEGAGVKRSGSRIQAAIALAVEAAARLGHVERRGEFLWQPGQGEVPIRDRSALPGASRRAELVAPEEYEAAILRVVAVAFGLEPAGVASAAGHLLGFSRVSDDLRARVEETVSSLLASGRLERRGEHLVAANPPSTTSMPDPLES